MKNFAKVTNRDSGCVTVTIWKDSGVIKGEVIGPTQWVGGTYLTKITRQEDSLSAERALEVATDLAKQLGVAIVVVDRKGAWNSDWGTLTYKTVH
jgi:hypothetical protein